MSFNWLLLVQFGIGIMLGCDYLVIKRLTYGELWLYRGKYVLDLSYIGLALDLM